MPESVRILGAGIYGLHIATALVERGHDVEIWESSSRVFSGASGNMPARLHCGAHYPRSFKTRQACRSHYRDFMYKYGEFTRQIPINIYAIAEGESLLDFETYRRILSNEIDILTVSHPDEHGLREVEGAVFTDERHVVVDRLAAHFFESVGDRITFGVRAEVVDDPRWALTIDATGCAHDAQNIDRYEPCLTLLLHGPTDRCVTVMDGMLPSIYVWDERKGLCSLTSAQWTPFARLATWQEARGLLDGPELKDRIAVHSRGMLNQMARYYPKVRDEFRVVDHRLAIRPMPRSAADARLVDVVRVGERAVRVRSGKLDAIFRAEREIVAMFPALNA